jgi:hypothetical protein
MLKGMSRLRQSGLVDGWSKSGKMMKIWGVKAMKLIRLVVPIILCSNKPASTSGYSVLII